MNRFLWPGDPALQKDTVADLQIVPRNRLAEPPSWWPTTSMVVTTQKAGAGICPAPEQDNACAACRACRERDVPNVAYRLH